MRLPFRQYLSVAYHGWHFWRARKELASNRYPSRRCLERLRYGWNNHAAAPVDLLQTLSELAVATSDPILECGSGITTILLEHIAAKFGVEVWSLEHSPKWAAIAARYAPHVRVRLCPMRDYGHFGWYAVPDDLPPKFGLIVCDGPMHDTKGGRSGLFPLLADHMDTTTTILLDDPDRDFGRLALECWTKDYQVSVERRGPFCIIKPNR